MKSKTEKPTAEAKALSLFLMAYKAKDPIYKERLKRINKRWDMVKGDELTRKEYDKEVAEMLSSYGGYDKVVEKTVQFYIAKTGEWKLEGDDKYCVDARNAADKISKK